MKYFSKNEYKSKSDGASKSVFGVNIESKQLNQSIFLTKGILKERKTKQNSGCKRLANEREEARSAKGLSVIS